jgi:hypothetical protein
LARKHARLLEEAETLARDMAEMDRLQAELDRLAAKHVGAIGAAKIGQQAVVGSLANLIDQYRKSSAYKNVQHKTRKFYDILLKRVLEECADAKITDFDATYINRLWEGWKAGGKITMARSLIGMVRSLVNFGATVLDDGDCDRASMTIHRMRFEMAPRSQKEPLTAAHVGAILSKAHEMGLPSVALAQALQFECGLHQKDVIGEWVPEDEPGISNVNSEDRIGRSIKWLRGLRWEDISSNWFLSFSAGNGRKPIEIDLSKKQMVMEEMGRMGFILQRPASGPIIKDDNSGRPYMYGMFRANWRKVADAAGVPRSVKNMDSHAGAGAGDEAVDTPAGNGHAPNALPEDLNLARVVRH